MSTTGACSEWHERMHDYDPSTPNGVYFAFMDTRYTTDQGEFSLVIEYGSPTISSSIWLTVLGQWVSSSVTYIVDY